MRLSKTKSKNATSLYVIKDVYMNGKRTTKIVEKLGTEKELRMKLNGSDPYVWAKKYIQELNKKEEAEKTNINATFSANKLISKGKRVSFNGGYLFLQDIFYDLKLDKICNEISKKYKFEYDLNSVLSRLLYTRILEPSSKLSSFEASKKYIEKPNFDLHHIYRALEVIAKESDFIESEVYKNSNNILKRSTGVLYYDCTNYFFETEQAEGFKQYGHSKENRPSPIIQMGLFMDASGIPLAFTIFDGNKNEQPSLKPLEKRIISDFNLSKFVVCTDAGLSSYSNRKFNDIGNRAFITTQSIKMLKPHLKEWALDFTGWRLPNSDKLINLNDIDISLDKEKVYYKERWINENKLEQKLIVTFSPKYMEYKRKIRDSQVERAQKMIDNPSSLKRKNQNDPKRLIDSTYCTSDGECATKQVNILNSKTIKEEEIYDGFYAVCTNLEDDAAKIIKINKGRWEIEESFRLLKSEFKARPVYLHNDDRIKVHFTTCFLALLLHRLLEKKLENKYTAREIITTLKEMNFMELNGEGYVPTYIRTSLTDRLHEISDFRTDTQIVTTKKMKEIINLTKQ